MTLDWLATHPHIEELPQLAQGLWNLTVVLQPHPNPQPKEEHVHTTMQANITMTLLQDIPTLDGQDFWKIEDCFMDIKTTNDILTRSHMSIEAITCGLTHTLFHRALQVGKSQDTRISNDNNLPNKGTSTASIYYSYLFPAFLPQTVSLTPCNKNDAIIMDISLQLTSTPWCGI